MRLVWSRQAREDLREIRAYSVRTWGSGKAMDYVGHIAEAAKALASGKTSGIDAGHVGPSFRRHIVASHSLWYMTQDNAVQIIRVLHQSRDATRILNKD